MTSDERLQAQAIMAGFFKALGHPTRLRILCLLRGGEMCVCHLERVVDRRQSYVSQQLMALRVAGLVATRREGTQVYYRLIDSRIEPILLEAGAPPPEPFSRIDGCSCPFCTAQPVASPVEMLSAV
ncbi:MAG: metalloregulator ArsR/SmtB family transcription factor [Anaerolineae bacterium]